MTVKYAAETMVLTTTDEDRLKMYEIETVRRICGPKRIQGEEIRRLVNFEVDGILKGEDVV